MSTFKYEYKLQGNGADSWIVSVIDDRNNVIDKYMFYGDINSIDPTNAIVIGKNQQHTLDVYKKIKKKIHEKSVLLVNLSFISLLCLLSLFSKNSCGMDFSIELQKKQ